MPARAKHSLGRFLKVLLFCEKDVWHESLRVAIDHPLKDITLLERVSLVIKGGVVYLDEVMKRYRSY